MRRLSVLIKIALLGLVGSVLLVSLLGKQDVTIYAMDFDLELMIFDQGYTVVNIPPLGIIRAKTHQLPLLFSITLSNVNLDRLGELVTDQPAAEILNSISQQLRHQVRIFLFRILAAAFLGGFGAGILFFHSYSRALFSGLAGLVAFSILIGSAVLTYNEEAFAAPQYEGVIEAAPWLMGVAEEVLVAVEDLDEKMQVLSANLLRLFDSLQYLSPVGNVGGEMQVLHISDIHNNPLSLALVAQITQAFAVDVIIDTGDITDYGTPVEASLLQDIDALGLPYVFVPGNHDSPAVINAFEQLENVTVLTEAVVTIEPYLLTIAGISDPASTSTEMAVPGRDAYSQKAETLASLIEPLEHPPDIIAAHHLYVVEEFTHLPLVLLHGHSHRPAISRQGEAVIIDAGTTGGAGVRGLLDRDETPFSMVLLHLDQYQEQWVLVAADIIKVFNINSGYVLERQLFPLPGDVDRLQIEEFIPQEEEGEEEGMNERLFFALELPDLFLESLFNQVDKQLRPNCGRARWVRRKHYHITLYFLGAYRGRREELITQAENVAKGHSPIQLSVSRWGNFPVRGNSQVLFAAISQGERAVQALRANLVQELSLPPGGKYIPHITVARGAKTVPERELPCPLSGVATHFALIDSELTRQGPSYTTVERFSLSGIARSE